jgi:hypothetical protein
MLTHVVCLRFDDLATAAEARDRLLAMAGRIPAMTGIEAGVDQTRDPRSYELALITRHADAAGLAAYQVHPVHQEVLAWLKERVRGAVAVDFES